ncbi:MAG: hypothetical protein MK206_01635 [Candidatus Poseidoniia archaeon]|jgi:hypothetical protein|nr:hypothetical protein [Candidatus Poseidoniia archaeon]|tara:strand:+ start:1378 stop:1617 length:240 start_codon:yes stop_codon:yes gene_type:complete
MLNEGKRTELLFFLREIVLEAGVSDKLAEPFMASLVAKGARESVDNAMEFLDSKIEEGFISADTREPIKKTMRRFTKMR